jgi:ACS family tartrate transporter-like MFS transporter
MGPIEFSTREQKLTIAKISLRILPLLVIGYLMAYIDRINISYAQLHMGTELGISAAAFGLVVGTFFIAYFIFEIPSNIIMRKVGSRLWLSRIMISWGLVTGLMGFVHSLPAVIACRFLLGVAEAGFFPGIILYLTYWFPERYRSVAIGWLILAQPGSYIIGGPIAGWVMDNVDWFGMPGWRWVFLFPGAVTVIIGIVILCALPERPGTSQWLSPVQKNWIGATLAAEDRGQADHSIRAQLSALRERRVFHLAAIYFLANAGGYGFSFFLPMIMRTINPGYSDSEIGLWSSLPFVAAALFTVILAWAGPHARSEKHVGLTLPVVVTIVGLAVMVYFQSQPIVAMIGMCATCVGVYAYGPSFFSIATKSISVTQAAVAIAAINSIGNLGGFVGPYLTGIFTGDSLASGMAPSISILIVCLVFVFLWRTPAVKPTSGSKDSASTGAVKEMPDSGTTPQSDPGE